MKKLFLAFPALSIALLTLVNGQSPAVEFTTIHRFNAPGSGSPPQNSGGFLELGSNGYGLVLDASGNFYGVTEYGGAAGWGTAYSVTPDGTLTTLAEFTDGLGGFTDAGAPGLGSIGHVLVQGADGLLYGISEGGGDPQRDSAINSYSRGDGTVFRINPVTGTREVMHIFHGRSGDTTYNPYFLVKGVDSALYGIARQNSPDGASVFRIGPDMAYSNLVALPHGMEISSLLAASDGNLYATRDLDTTTSAGDILRITPAGAVAKIYSFPSSGAAARISTLVEGSDRNLYGCTAYGGPNGSQYGTVFRITPAGVLTTLHTFSGGAADGGSPMQALVEARDGNFYGSTSIRTDLGYDEQRTTFFSISPAGEFAKLAELPAYDQTHPERFLGEIPSSLVQGQDGSLYGTIGSGHSDCGFCSTPNYFNGSIFKLSFGTSSSPTPSPSASPSATVSPTASPGPSASPSASASPSPTAGPVITSVKRQYPGVFLQGTNVDNRFDVGVNWNGQPGFVDFAIGGTSIASDAGGSGGALHIFQMGSDFTPSFTPIQMSVTARNQAGQKSAPNLQQICVVPFPSWLTAANADGKAFEYKIANGDVKSAFKADFPNPHLAKEGPIDIPASIPFIGGKFGLKETFAHFEAEVSSNAGTGSVTLSGQTGFTAAGQTLTGKVSGTGSVLLLCGTGLQLDSTAFKLNLSGEIKKEAGVADVIPALIALQRAPVIGRAVAWFNKHATLTGELEPSLDFGATFKQDSAGNLKFNETTGEFGLKLKATLQGNVTKNRLSASGWVAGGGTNSLALPTAPFVRKVKITFEAGAEFKLDAIIKKDWKGQTAYNCTWTPETGTVCGKTQDGAAATNRDGSLLEADSDEAASYSMIEQDYTRFGPYAEFHQAAPSTSATGSAATVVGNVFAGAAPTLIALQNGGQLLLWAHADTSLPPTQATGIMWSMRDAEGNWSQPQLIVNDTRAEFSPVAGLDGNGKVVAGWLRVKDPNFPATISTDQDVANFYKSFEVVTADFDPATRTWSSVTALTDDTALDTDLELSSDGAGALLLSWISNPNAEMMSTAESPASLKYSFRSDGKWMAPAVLADSLVGVSSHTAAMHGKEGFIILPHDPDADAATNGVLDVYRLTNGSWSGPQAFAAGALDNRLPSAAYDTAGVGRIVWQRGGDFVSATLDDATPVLLRPGSTGFGFYDAHLVSGQNGKLALLYEQPVTDGAANLFASTYYPAANSWGDGRQIVQDAHQMRNPSAYIDNAGQLQVAYLSTEIQRTTRNVTINGVPEVVENVPVEGQTDLKTTTVDGGVLTPSVFANIATRMRVDTGENSLIGGFYITGSRPKKVLIRALAPSLSNGGVAGALDDPTLELDRNTPESRIFNDDWQQGDTSQIPAGFAPKDPREALIIATLTPGPHTAIVSGKNDHTGVAIVEVYDLETSHPEALANIATRGLVQTGDNVMIGGFIVTGTAPVKLLVRVTGPTLANNGISGALADPTLELHDGNGAVINRNDNWRETQETEIGGTGIAPANDNEPAILATLAPGNYTAVVRGANDTTGIAVVEAYNLP